MRTTETVGAAIIRCASATNASKSFVEQVQDRFREKGVSLDEDSTPFVAAIEQAFGCEAKIRSVRACMRIPVLTSRVRCAHPQTAPGVLVNQMQHEVPPMVPGPAEEQ